MAEPTTDISTQIQESLKDTPYACKTLTKLSGGTANFVFRGILAVPLADGSKTVVAKHTPPYVASNPGFKLTDERCEYEETILSALHSLPPSIYGSIKVQTPQLYEFLPKTHTQIHSDLPAPTSTDLKTYCLTHGHTLSKPQSLRLGKVLGVWCKRLHDWAAADEQKELRTKMMGNKEMRELKYQINYDMLVRTVAVYPQILGESKDCFEGVRDRVRKEFDSEEGELIHGDFWTGNILLPNHSLSETEETPIYIIDWELSHLSSKAFDLGQMFAELYELTYFKNIRAGVWMIEGFMDGYGKLEGDMNWKVVVYVGVHLICWGSRVQGWGTKEQVDGIVGVGRDWVVKGVERDRAFFETGPLGCLFG